MDKMRTGYKPPSRKAISTTLLDNAVRKNDNAASDCISMTPYCSVVVDGWSNARREGVVNVVLLSPKPILLAAVDTKDDHETSLFLAKIVEKEILKLPLGKVVGIVTDNAKNVLGMGAILSDKCSMLVCVPCAAHSLNLVCKDIFKLQYFNIMWEEVFLFLMHLGK